MSPRVGTSRYEALASFLEEVMQDPKASRRVRLSAAQRLDSLLARQERREASEARRIEREILRAAKAQDMVSAAKDVSPPDIGEDERLQRAQELIAGIVQKGNELQKS